MAKSRITTPIKNNWIVGIILLLLVTLFCVCCCNKEYFNTQFVKLKEYFGVLGCLATTTVGDQSFCQIGNGPAIDRTAMYKWMGTGSNSYTNHEGVLMFLNSAQYRSINGFLPPSFAFFPYGLDKDEYRPEDPSVSVLDPTKADYNTEEGRAICLQACKDTDCIAVQTEVPQMCYEKRVQVTIPSGFGIDGISTTPKTFTTKNDCKGKATHSCTLFYRDVEKADDSYFDLSGGLEALNDPLIPVQIGQKYYENNRAPSISPGDGTKKPSDETVKWCKPQVTNISQPYVKYKTNVGSPECTCEPGDTECTDTNCCVYRDLITSEWAKNNTPYYNLPINVTKTAEIEDGSPASICPAKNEFEDCCGYCQKPDGTYELRSCPQNKQYLDGTLSNPLALPPLDRSGKGLYKPKQTCNSNSDCGNGACARPDASGSNMWCCPSGDYYSYFGTDYCTGIADGLSCKSNGACACGDCKGFGTGACCVDNSDGSKMADSEYLPHTGGGTWWGVDTDRAQCLWPEKKWWETWLGYGWMIDLFGSGGRERRDMEDCLEEYAAIKNKNPKEAYRKLTTCCGYLDQVCVDIVSQPFCSTKAGSVTRGCFGDPHILTVDTVGEIGACDNPAVISPDNRCVQDSNDKACTGFPYACESGPLWVMQ